MSGDALINANRQVLCVFEQYQKARLLFAQSIADLATKMQNLPQLQALGAPYYLQSMLVDGASSIQRTATLALGRMASHSDEMAQMVIDLEIIPRLIEGLKVENQTTACAVATPEQCYKRSAAFVLRSVARHCAELAEKIVESGALEGLIYSLQESDTLVRESCAWALASIAKHSEDLAKKVTQEGALKLLFDCLNDEEIFLKRVAASALSEICKHSEELSKEVIEEFGGLTHMCEYFVFPDVKLRRAVLSCLTNIARQTEELASRIVETEIFPALFELLQDRDELICKSTVVLLLEIMRHSEELAQAMVTAGCVCHVVQFVSQKSGPTAIPGIHVLQILSSYSEDFANLILNNKGIEPLCAAVINDANDDETKIAAGDALSQICNYGDEYSDPVAETNCISKLLELSQCKSRTEEIREEFIRILKNLLECCNHVPTLEILLHGGAPENIMESVVSQYGRILQGDAKGRKNFVTAGGLRRTLEIRATAEPELQAAIDNLISCFPDDVIKFYTPSYLDDLLTQVEGFAPPPAAPRKPPTVEIPKKPVPKEFLCPNITQIPASAQASTIVSQQASKISSATSRKSVRKSKSSKVSLEESALGPQESESKKGKAKPKKGKGGK